MRLAVAEGGVGLVPGTDDRRSVEAAGRDWRAWVDAGDGGSIQPTSSQGGAVDLGVFFGDAAEEGWFKVYGLRDGTRRDGGPVVRWAETGAGAEGTLGRGGGAAGGWGAGF